MSETPSSDDAAAQPVDPDHPDTVAALKDIGARLDLNEQGRIWRVFFYDRNQDDDLAHIHGLRDLKEVWLLGTKVTRQGAERLKERLPEVTVYH